MVLTSSHSLLSLRPNLHSLSPRLPPRYPALFANCPPCEYPLLHLALFQGRDVLVAVGVNYSSSTPREPYRVGLRSCVGGLLDDCGSVPKPDDKIQSMSLKVEGGGNVGNALTSAARLGLNPRVISKVANDAQGRIVLAELEIDGVEILLLWWKRPREAQGSVFERKKMLKHSSPKWRTSNTT